MARMIERHHLLHHTRYNTSSYRSYRLLLG